MPLTVRTNIKVFSMKNVISDIRIIRAPGVQVVLFDR
jgi:hypothetical protein